MNEMHGVADVKKLAYTATSTQAVTVTDRDGYIEVSLTGNSYPAGISPEEAHFLAKALVESARRVERRKLLKNMAQKQNAE